MLPMLSSLRRAQEESEAVTDSMLVPSRKGMGKLQNHIRNGASRTWYLAASDMEPVRTRSSMNAVTMDTRFFCYLLPCCLWWRLADLCCSDDKLFVRVHWRVLRSPGNMFFAILWGAKRNIVRMSQTMHSLYLAQSAWKDGIVTFDLQELLDGWDVAEFEYHVCM